MLDAISHSKELLGGVCFSFFFFFFFGSRGMFEAWEVVAFTAYN